MGALLAKLVDKWGSFVRGREARIILIGLDAAGKTSILYKVKLDENVTTIPTLGFNVEQIQYKKVNFEAWDIGGQDILRPLWRHYFQNTDAVIYVVDSNDRERISEACETLEWVLSDDALSGAKLLVYANKQDLPNALPAQDMCRRLKLDTLPKARDWFLQPCCAKTGEGLFEGLDWLSTRL